jgi:hypothetical protein
MANTFAKKASGPNQLPAGTHTFTIANAGPWTIATGTPLSVTAAEAAWLRQSPFLQES